MNTKKIIKTGMTSMVGSFTLGTMAGLPGMPAQAQGISNIGNSALMLGNVGMLAQTVMDVVKMPGMKKSKGKKNSMW
jgi:hypothetical protein